MANSILDETKQMLGIPATDTAFDVDVINNINSAFMVLTQLGVGPEEGFSITDNTSEWVDFLTDVLKYQSVKMFVYYSVRLSFDPPGTSFLIDAMKQQKQELEFRLQVQVPTPPVV